MGMCRTRWAGSTSKRIYPTAPLTFSAIWLRISPNGPPTATISRWRLYQKGDRASAKKECEAALRSKPSKEEEAKIRDLMAKLG